MSFEEVGKEIRLSFDHITSPLDFYYSCLTQPVGRSSGKINVPV